MTSKFQVLTFLLFLFPHAQSLYFNYTSFYPDTRDIILGNDACLPNGGIQLTENKTDRGSSYSVGRASFAQPVRLWDETTKMRTNFTTHFAFRLPEPRLDPENNEAIAFFLAPFDNSTASAPDNSAGWCLGLIGGNDKNCSATSKYPFVAVEFDDLNNEGLTQLRAPSLHVSSAIPQVTTPWVCFAMNGTAVVNATITYDSSAKNLSVHVTCDSDYSFNQDSKYFYFIDLSSVLPERVRVGFSSATTVNYGVQNILSWDFNSTLEDINDANATRLTGRLQNQTGKNKMNAAMKGGLVVAISVLLLGVVSLTCLWWRRVKEEDDFDKTGPRKFEYIELRDATKQFSNTEMIGEGGYGQVYKGEIEGSLIAVKTMSDEKKGQQNSYKAEVKIISQLRHRNLVELRGWCHAKKQKQLLLVYEFVSNKSLDFHIYPDRRNDVVLSWVRRFSIVKGLVSALLYLHEETKECVLHRDIKLSNVLLDVNFEAKLGDFGIARLVDHELTSLQTDVAGTPPYIAPECFNGEKPSKKTDIYSFGIVVLEIVCGKKCWDSMFVTRNIAAYVWGLYGDDRLFEAADEELRGRFDERQMKLLMMVGLWCCHPNRKERPSIGDVSSALEFKSELPSLPKRMPDYIPIKSSQLQKVPSLYYTPTDNISCIANSSTQSVASGKTPLLNTI